MQDLRRHHLEDRSRRDHQLRRSRRLRCRAITKSITIGCEGTFAGILAAGTNAININGVGVIVTLRNLSIESVGTGLIGINFINGRLLCIENCKIFGFRSGTAVGIKFSPPAGVNAELYVSGTTIGHQWGA